MATIGTQPHLSQAISLCRGEVCDPYLHGFSWGWYELVYIRPGGDGQASSRISDGQVRPDDNGQVRSRGGDSQVWVDNGDQCRLTAAVS